jgi:hypothetical protein
MRVAIVLVEDGDRQCGTLSMSTKYVNFNMILNQVRICFSTSMTGKT